MATTGWTNSDFLTTLNILASVGVGVAVVIATFRGPLVATREADTRRAETLRRADKMRIFRDLMGYRYDVTHLNFVTALNLVQIDFADSPKVMAAFDAYLSAFHPDNTDKPGTQELRLKAVIRLLSATGDDLGYKLEQLDVMEQIYSPKHWWDIADAQKTLRDFFVEIAEGKKGLPVFTIYSGAYVEDLGDGKLGIRTVPTSPPRPADEAKDGNCSPE